MLVRGIWGIERLSCQRLQFLRRFKLITNRVERREVLDIAITGGIGSGKSTVAEMLAAKGAVHLNADAIVHDLQQPGGAVFEAMVEHFGNHIVSEDGTLNRQAVADIVFNDTEQLEALNKIVHPGVRQEMQRRRDELRQQRTDVPLVVISEIPLLVEGRLKEAPPDTHQPQFDGIVVVVAYLEVVLARLAERGVSEADARARIAKQASNEERLAIADFVIDNSGPRSSLAGEIDRCWSWITGLAV